MIFGKCCFWFLLKLTHIPFIFSQIVIVYIFINQGLELALLCCDLYLRFYVLIFFEIIQNFNIIVCQIEINYSLNSASLLLFDSRVHFIFYLSPYKIVQYSFTTRIFSLSEELVDNFRIHERAICEYVSHFIVDNQLKIITAVLNRSLGCGVEIINMESKSLQVFGKFVEVGSSDKETNYCILSHFHVGFPVASVRFNNFNVLL